MKEVNRILHPNTTQPDIKLLEMFKDGIKVAECDITNMTGDEVWEILKWQEMQDRTWTYKTIKPYNWPRFDAGKEVER